MAQILVHPCGRQVDGCEAHYALARAHNERFAAHYMAPRQPARGGAAAGGAAAGCEGGGCLHEVSKNAVLSLVECTEAAWWR